MPAIRRGILRASRVARSLRVTIESSLSGVYSSYPFCAQKCTYCDFASGVFPRHLQPLYLDALGTEIRAHRWAWAPDTVYLGGGTPSNLAPADLHHILALIPGRPWSEATME